MFVLWAVQMKRSRTSGKSLCPADERVLLHLAGSAEGRLIIGLERNEEDLVLSFVSVAFTEVGKPDSVIQIVALRTSFGRSGGPVGRSGALRNTLEMEMKPRRSFHWVIGDRFTRTTMDLTPCAAGR